MTEYPYILFHKSPEQMRQLGGSRGPRCRNDDGEGRRR